MGIEQDIIVFMAKLDAAINETMLNDVANAAKDEIADAVQSEVYDKYRSEAESPYIRRGKYNGGLQDREAMVVTDYDSASHTITIEDRSTENDLLAEDADGNSLYGRLIAPIVEKGTGYTWEYSGMYIRQPFPRPFHKVAEKRFAQNGNFEKALEKGLKARGIALSK